MATQHNVHERKGFDSGTTPKLQPGTWHTDPLELLPPPLVHVSGTELVVGVAPVFHRPCPDNHGAVGWFVRIDSRLQQATVLGLWTLSCPGIFDGDLASSTLSGPPPPPAP